jgi:hypothetical protein
MIHITITTQDASTAGGGQRLATAGEAFVVPHVTHGDDFFHFVDGLLTDMAFVGAVERNRLG